MWKLYHGGDEHVPCIDSNLKEGSNLYIVNKCPNSRRSWHVIDSLPLETDLTYDFIFLKILFNGKNKNKKKKERNNVMNWHLLFALVMEDKKVWKLKI